MRMRGGEAPGVLVGVTLRPPELEAEYRSWFLRTDGRTAAVVAGGLTLIAGVFIANDARLVGPSAFGVLLALRFLHGLVTIGLIWAAFRTRRPAVLDAWALAWVACIALYELVTQSTRPPDYLLPVAADLVLVITAWALLPNRFSLQGIGAGLITVTSIAWVLAFRDRPAPAASLLIANTLLASNLAAGFVSWRLHRTRRRQFLAEKEQVDVATRLRGSQERLQAVLDASTDGFWERDVPTGRVLHSARMNELTGRPAADTWAASDDWLGRTHPDDLAQVGPVYEEVLAGRQERFDLTFRTRHADGTWRWLRSRGKVTARDGSGKPLRVAGTVTDVHAQRQAEEALQRSEYLRRTVMENFPNGLVGLFDRDLRCVMLDGANTVTATDPHAWLGKSLQDISPPGLLPVVEPACRAALAGETRRLQLPLGGHWIDVLLRPVRDASGEVVQGLFMTQDVTEKRALEEQLVVASRLAALGTLVAGVAHEINNPLTGVLAGQGGAIEEVEAARSALGSGEALDRHAAGVRLEEALDALRDAQGGGHRIARIVKDLSLFGRPDPRRVRTRIIDVVDDAMRWLPASIPGSTTIRVENRGAPDVLASPGQMGQVLVNLVTNASRSMEGRRGEVAIVVGPGGPGMARLEVTDDGVGMAPDVLKRIFDPFFTTRKVGEGTGLGLPICHSIVTAHGGAITASSTPGAGSTFRVELPAVLEET